MELLGTIISSNGKIWMISKSFVVVRNTFNFVKTYVAKAGKPKGLKIEDKWILSKLNTLVENCTQYNRSFNVYKSSKRFLISF